MMHSTEETNTSFKIEAEEAWITDLDPILEGGFKTVYRQQLCIEIRSIEEDGNSVGVKDMMTFRIISRAVAEGYAELKLEISSETNLFVLYIAKIDDKKFEKMKKLQHLNFNYQQLLPMLIKQLNICDKNINQYSAIFYLNKISAHRLDFLENIEYKRIELISFEFEELDAESIKNYVTYRFTKAKANNQIIQNRLKDMMGIVKLKNPNLIATISKKILNHQSTDFK